MPSAVADPAIGAHGFVKRVHLVTPTGIEPVFSP